MTLGQEQLLRIAACTTAGGLATLLDSVSWNTAPSSDDDDALRVLESVPESLGDSDTLVNLLNSHLHRHPKQHQKQLTGADDDQWISAVVRRAESIDQHTGRLDWASAWLEAASQQWGQDIPKIQQALLNTDMLSTLDTAGTTSLGHLNSMSRDTLADWAATQASKLSLADDLAEVIANRGDTQFGALVLEKLLIQSRVDSARAFLRQDTRSAATTSSGVVSAFRAAAAHTLENATPGNATAAAAQRARQLLAEVLPAEHRTDPSVQHTLRIADAVQLAASLRRPSKDTGLSPALVLHAQDPYDLVRDLLLACPDAYRRPRVVREFAALVNPSQNPDKEAQALSDAHISGLLMQAAVSSSDTSAAHGFVRSFMSSAPADPGTANLAALVRARHSSNSSSSTYSSGTAEEPHGTDIGGRALQCVWRAAAALTQLKQCSVEARADALALSLRLCPPAHMSQVLDLDPASVAEHSPYQISGDSSLPASVLVAVHQELYGQPADQTHSTGDNNTHAAVSTETMRTFDSAILRRCLQAASRTPEGHSDRDRLLLEWLDFAMAVPYITNGQSPQQQLLQKQRDEQLPLRQAIERELTAATQSASTACNFLADNTWPKINPIDHKAVMEFYRTYAVMVGSTKDSRAEQQADLRAKLAESLIESSSASGSGSPSVAELVAAATDCDHKRGAERIWRATGSQAIVLAPLLAQLRPLPQIDNPPSPIHTPDATSTDNNSDTWTSETLTSALALCHIEDLLDTASTPSKLLTTTPNPIALLTSAKDQNTLCTRLAFGPPQGAISQNIDQRLAIVNHCCENLPDTTGSNCAQRAQYFIEFLNTLHTLRDPFSFARVPERCVQMFSQPKDLPMFLQVGIEDLTGDMLWQACRQSLITMVFDLEPAYFVCQAFIRCRSLITLWDNTTSVGSLCDIYAQALETPGLDAPTVVAICSSPLELCTFDFSPDVSLINELVELSRDFGPVVLGIAEGQRQLSLVGDPLGRTERLALMELLKPEDKRLRLQVLADQLWSVAVPDEASEQQAWKQLLILTTSGDQVNALVDLLFEMSEPDQTTCWTNLLIWTVEKAHSTCFDHAVLALLHNPSLCTAQIGERVFDDNLLTNVSDMASDPQRAAALAILGLVYPISSWAEQCLEPAVALCMSDENGQLSQQIFAQNHPLMLCILLKGYVPAFLGYSDILDSLCQVLLGIPGLLQENMLCRALMQGVNPQELLATTVHALWQVGLEQDRALQLVYVFLQVPEEYRAYCDELVTSKWVRQMDMVVYGKSDIDVSSEKEAEQVKEASVNKQDIDILAAEQGTTKSRSRSTSGIHVDVEDKVEEEEAAGWGESDIELDDDDDLEEQLAEKSKEDIDKDKISPSTITQTKAQTEPEQEPETEPEPKNTAKDTDNVVDGDDDDDDDDAHGWGDDDSVDLDADLDAL